MTKQNKTDECSVIRFQNDLIMSQQTCVALGDFPPDVILSIAKQSTATCELSTSGECALKYTGEEALSG